MEQWSRLEGEEPRLSEALDIAWLGLDSPRPPPHPGPAYSLSAVRVADAVPDAGVVGLGLDPDLWERWASGSGLQAWGKVSRTPGRGAANP